MKTLSESDHAALEHDVVRKAIYIPAAPHFMFGFYHFAPLVAQTGLAALICSPIGHEYSNTHRAVRHLADDLARAGVPSLRFDYHGTGNSYGEGPEVANPDQWQADIKYLIEYLKTLTGAQSVGLVGIRFGALLATIVATEFDVPFLVLWNACVSGRRFIREMRAHAIGTGVEDSVSRLETGGVLFSSCQLAAIHQMQLTLDKLTPKTDILIVGKSPDIHRIAESSRQSTIGRAIETVEVSDLDGMMAEPQYTVVPIESIRGIVRWMAGREGVAATCASLMHSTSNRLGTSTEQLTPSYVVVNRELEERICRFGPSRELFGILHLAASKCTLAVVMFSAGSQHNVGPNRLYVGLARQLATKDISSFRVDLRGLGESVVQPLLPENDVYPSHAQEDVTYAISYLKDTFGFSEFIFMGLCSGAHTAFHAAVAHCGDHQYRAAILINPLTYRWPDVTSLGVNSQAKQAAYYAKSFRRREKWLKLLQGRANVQNIFMVIVRQLRAWLLTGIIVLREALGQDRSPISTDLRRLWDRGETRIALFLGDGEPGLEILKRHAPYQVFRGSFSGRLTIHRVAGADHVFSRFQHREKLYEQVSATICKYARQ